MARTAGVLLIGNELLTGKIEDRNLPFLARELFAAGISLTRTVICRDDVQTIADEVNALRGQCDHVITTGGVGPTHDDVTLEAVAVALGRPLVSAPVIEQLLRDYFGDRVTDAHLRMALVPEGSELVVSAEVPWPTVCAEEVYVFPGVPEILVRKWPAVRSRLVAEGHAETAFVGRALFTTLDEFELAEPLREVAAAHPRVTVGSYLLWGTGDYQTKVTFDGEVRVEVEAAITALKDALGLAVIVRES